MDQPQYAMLDFFLHILHIPTGNRHVGGHGHIYKTVLYKLTISLVQK